MQRPLISTSLLVAHAEHISIVDSVDRPGDHELIFENDDLSNRVTVYLDQSALARLYEQAQYAQHAGVRSCETRLGEEVARHD